ncbi:MAG: ceramidase domain-containing protein [Alphaproteobacteria bacterium]|nr:ceramidase domain-containing protein [Alphaproteobacteria bacterium]
MAASVPPMMHGPIYCETGHPWLGIAEPINTITNAAILIAAYYAYRHVRKSQVGFSADLVILLVLLAGVGIGSTLWHGLRTHWALELDWMPGVGFLVVFTALWFRQLFGWWAGIAGAALMYAATVGAVALAWSSFDAMPNVPSGLRFVPGFGVITVFGLALVAGSMKKYGQALGLRGIVILACGVAAAAARSIDLIVCPVIPTGTHFLWHLLLSTSAFLGILMLVRMKKMRKEMA